MPLELLLFDMDGTLVRYEDSAFHSSWDALGFAAGKKEEWLKLLEHYYPYLLKLYEEKESEEEINRVYEEWLQKNCQLLKGISVEQTLSRILPPPYLPGLKEFFQYLNQKPEKPRTGLVTSGADLVADYLRQDFSLDFIIANEVHVHNGCFTGTGKNNVPLWRKGEIIQKIMEKYRVPPEKTAFFGDHENDISAWQMAGYPLAINLNKNKPEVREKCLLYVKESFEDFYQALEWIKKLK